MNDPSRREFINLTAAGAISAATGLSCSGNGGGGFPDTGNPDSGNPDTKTFDTGVRDSGVFDGGTPELTTRVARVINSRATTWNPSDRWQDYYQYGVQSVIDQMFEEGLKALTNTESLDAAWQQLIPYGNGERVAVHVNAYCNNDNSAKNNVYQPMSSLVQGLVDVLGVPPENIAVVDSSRKLVGSPAEARLINSCRYTDRLGWDRHHGEYVENPVPFTPGHDPGEALRLSRVMEEADHLIIVPVLSWHGGHWITATLKSMMGEYTGAGGGLHNNADGYPDWGNGARLADICVPVRDKVRLVVGEGIFGNIEGNSSSPHAFQTLGGQGGQHPSSTLYFSCDMVAADSIMYDDLLAEAEAAGSPKRNYHVGFLGHAADDSHRLGVFEMKAVTGKSAYDRIALIDR